MDDAETSFSTRKLDRPIKQACYVQQVPTDFLEYKFFPNRGQLTKREKSYAKKKVPF